MAYTEMEHTNKMFQVLTSLLGEEYKVFSNQEMLELKRPYCRHATSHPKILVFIRKLDIFTRKVLPSVVVMGEAGEDEKVGLAGEIQWYKILRLMSIYLCFHLI